ncbi:MAG: hypothetical protein WCS69_10470 [Ignavibacteriaceae bacterium]|jgi:hypothetical protein
MQHKLNGILVLLLFCFSFSAFAQVIEKQKEKIEIVGIHSREGKEILKKILEAVKDETFHICAADFKHVYHIPEASVNSYVTPPKYDSMYTFIKFVDPIYKERIHFIENFPDTLAEEKDWEKISLLFSDYSFSIGSILQVLGGVNATNFDSIAKSRSYYMDTSAFRIIFETVTLYNKESDKEKAIWTLENDGNFTNRRNAVLLLKNFMDDDLAMLHIIRAIRHDNASVSGIATDLIGEYSPWNNGQRDWSFAAEELRYIIDGTNLFAFNQVLEMLTRTKVSTSHAPKLLKGGGDLILDNLKAEHEREKTIAHNFLVQISGKDFGYDADKWQEWIKLL